MKKLYIKEIILVLVVPLILLMSVNLISIYDVFPRFSYTGLNLQTSEADFLIHLALFLFPLLVNYRFNRNNFISVIVILTVHLPISSYFYVGDLALQYYLIETFCIVLMIFSSKLKFSFRINISPITIKILGGLFSVSLLLLLFINKFWLYFSLNLTELYANRFETEMLYRYGLQYLLVWAYKVIVPCLIAAAYMSRRWTILGICLFLSIALLFITFRKEVIIYPALALFLSWVISSDRDVASWISLSQLFLLLFIATISMIAGDDILTPYVHRAFVVVGHNFSDYIVFFEETDYLWFSQSFLAGILDSGLSDKVPQLIGGIRYGFDSNAFSNAGFWASAYMQGGVFMMVIYSILVGLLSGMVTNVIRRTHARKFKAISVVAAVCGFLQLVNGDLPTALLTHGLGVAIVIVFMMRSLDRRVLSKKYHDLVES